MDSILTKILNLSTQELGGLGEFLGGRIIALDPNDPQFMIWVQFADIIVEELARREKNEG